MYAYNNSTNATSGDGGAIAIIDQSASATTTVDVNSCTLKVIELVRQVLLYFICLEVIMAKNGARLT